MCVLTCVCVHTWTFRCLWRSGEEIASLELELGFCALLCTDPDNRTLALWKSSKPSQPQDHLCSPGSHTSVCHFTVACCHRVHKETSSGKGAEVLGSWKEAGPGGEQWDPGVSWDSCHWVGFGGSRVTLCAWPSLQKGGSLSVRLPCWHIARESS